MPFAQWARWRSPQRRPATLRIVLCHSQHDSGRCAGTLMSMRSLDHQCWCYLWSSNASCLSQKLLETDTVFYCYHARTASLVWQQRWG
jgi:hypothetical protein